MEDEEVDIEERIVRLTGEINEDVSEKVVKALHAMCEAEQAPITVAIHSDGGSLEDGFRIIDALNIAKTRGSSIHTIVTGKAYSMAAIILCVGDARTAYTNARIMFHSSRFEEGDMPTLTKTELKDMYEEMSFYDGKFNEILLGIGVPQKTIDLMLSKDYFIDTIEAIRLGIVQSVEHDFI